jgi:hypothetical protein
MQIGVISTNLSEDTATFTVPTEGRDLLYVIIIIIIIIFINCNWVVTRWQWLFNTYTKHEIGLLLNLRREGHMRSM